jgi:hypothetical protein
MDSFNAGVAEAMIKVAEGEEQQPRGGVPTWAKAVGGVALGAGGVLLARRALRKRFPTMGRQGPLKTDEVARAAKGTAAINKRRGG